LAPDEARAIGGRVFQKLTPQQRDELRQFLLSALTAPIPSATDALSPDPRSVSLPVRSWKQVVEDAASSAFDRRLASASDEEISATDIVQEVLPVAHAAVPQQVRKELFMRIKNMIHGIKAGTE
jgi:hypothetical protein